MVFTQNELATLAKRYLVFQNQRTRGSRGPFPGKWTLSLQITESHDKLISRLINGKGITAAMAERASQWFIENWPDTLAWPDDIADPRCADPCDGINGPYHQSSIRTIPVHDKAGSDNKASKMRQCNPLVVGNTK